MKKIWVWMTVVALLATYAPFLGSRYIRTGGDEKVYVNQAMEMARDGRWFVQTINDKPAYYKGPVHYLLVRVGAETLGRSAWAVLYMNLLFLILGALATGAIVRRRLPDWEEGAVWAGVFFGLGVGIYAHTFASQMEVELAGAFAIALFLLDRLKPAQAGFLFWIVAGMAGWIKAPLHSAFLGVSALLYWALTEQFLQKAKNPKAWAAALLGVAVGVAGYLPAFFLDRENFVQHFIIKEIYQKSFTGQSAWTPIASTYGFYLFPWVFFAAVAYLQGLWQLPRYLVDRQRRSLVALVLSFCLPSLLFFIYHPYRFENYNLPVISAWVLFLTSIWHYRTRSWQRLYSLGFGLLAALFLAAAVFVTVMYFHFAPLPVWWPWWLLPVVWIGMLSAAFILVKHGVLEGGRRPARLAWAAVGAYWALGAFFSLAGEREMRDIRQYLRDADTRGEKVTLAYYNLMENIWSEWGLLNFWVDRPVRGIFTPEKLKQAVLAGDVILVPAGEGLEGFQTFMKKELPEVQLHYTAWKRWQTHGGADTGKPLWREAWERRDFSVLERDFQIVKRVP